MGINIVVAVTDYDWYTTLRARPELTEINFWSPSARGFQALREGELFLFKLHAPHNKIVGGGIFAYSNTLPSSLAWEAFGEGNGARSLLEMRDRIVKYRRGQPERAGEFDIGCRVLTQPFFFDESDWIDPPASWKPNIVTYKGFDTDSEEGRRLWTAVQTAIRSSGVVAREEEPARFGDPQVVQPRLGQGLFRVRVTDLYGRRCAVTGERTLPALDAAHIVPYAQGGTHDANNGLLLRRDVHSLFDAGYVTVTPSFQFRVSRMIEAEFRNGRSYYTLDGSRIRVPDREELRPAQDALAWHNETLYRG
ncbi:MAG: HNH endonuclease [Chloroflexi bacterium]|nr:HNH endonuclease [Chloroflexota bacterium]